ncbi:LLM class flavin-dependent oxidoreductase [Streptomyces sp. NPDC059679]|uniref:LLM class flavin-dependent oxidoreductase n=1 Tax=Streptomyces sp. NPDC059679 TaxID=3346903 RepID=UPI0036C2D0EC
MTYRIGAVLEPHGTSVPEVLERAVLTEELGVSSQWLIQMPGRWEAGTVLGALAARTRKIELGSAILPLYSRPPVVMASTALTLAELSEGRFALGLGLGRRGVGEWMVGAGTMPSALPAMREYMKIVLAVTRDGEVDVDGTWFSGHAFFPSPSNDRPELPVYMGAFGPKMLELAGELADGVLLWMCTPEYVRDVAMPALSRGFERRTDGRHPGGEGFDVALLLCAAVTPDPETDRDGFADYLSNYVRVPTYRRLFEASGYGAQLKSGRPDREMVEGLGVIGTAAELRARMDRFAAEGVTQILVSPTSTAFLQRDRYLATVQAALG